LKLREIHHIKNKKRGFWEINDRKGERNCKYYCIIKRIIKECN